MDPAQALAEKRELHELLSAGVTINEAPVTGWTPLHRACRLGDTGIVRGLLSAKADPTVLTLFGDTPLHLAAVYGHAHVVKAMLDGGADPNAASKRSKWTPLHAAAAHSSHAGVAALLLQARADTNLVGRNGLTPVQLAQRSQNAAVLAWHAGDRPTVFNMASRYTTSNAIAVSPYLTAPKSPGNSYSEDQQRAPAQRTADQGEDEATEMILRAAPADEAKLRQAHDMLLASNALEKEEDSPGVADDDEAWRALANERAEIAQEKRELQKQKDNLEMAELAREQKSLQPLQPLHKISEGTPPAAPSNDFVREDDPYWREARLLELAIARNSPVAPSTPATVTAPPSSQLPESEPQAPTSSSGAPKRLRRVSMLASTPGTRTWASPASTPAPTPAAAHVAIATLVALDRQHR